MKPLVVWLKMLTALLLFVLAAHGQQSLYIDATLPNSHPLKKELVKKLKQSGKVMIVSLPETADLILTLDQTGRGMLSCNPAGGIILASIFSSGCGNRGRVVLKNRQKGEELWSEEKGGAWQWSGLSAAKVGRKLGNDLVKFLSQDPSAHARGSSTPSSESRDRKDQPENIAPKPAVDADAHVAKVSNKGNEKEAAPKCAGRSWYTSPNGDPICVWNHDPYGNPQ